MDKSGQEGSKFVFVKATQSVENNTSNGLCAVGAANTKERSLFFSVSEVKSGITPRIVCAHSRRGGVVFPRTEKVNLIVRLVKSCSTVVE